MNFGFYSPTEFIMPSMKTRSVYRINQLLMAVKLKLTKKDDTPIPASGNVALGNDVLNLLWNSSTVLLNNVPVNR